MWAFKFGLWIGFSDLDDSSLHFVLCPNFLWRFPGGLQGFVFRALWFDSWSLSCGFASKCGLYRCWGLASRNSNCYCLGLLCNVLPKPPLGRGFGGVTWIDVVSNLGRNPWFDTKPCSVPAQEFLLALPMVCAVPMVMWYASRYRPTHVPDMYPSCVLVGTTYKTCQGCGDMLPL